MMTIEKINNMPTLIKNSHESILRSYQILELVKDMLRRGDSKETIEWVIEQCEKEHEVKAQG